MEVLRLKLKKRVVMMISRVRIYQLVLAVVILLCVGVLANEAFSQHIVTESNDWIEIPEGKQAVFIPEYMKGPQCTVVCRDDVMFPDVVNPDVTEPPVTAPIPGEDILSLSPSNCTPFWEMP